MSKTVQLYVRVLLMSVSWNFQSSGSVTPTRPNIIFILADDLGFRDVGFHGSTVIKTPTIDRLAYNGVRLDNYYVQPICSPTRSQLLSGRYQIHTGLQHGIITPCQPRSLPKEIPTLADKLHDAGYATHMVGKWHIGYYEEQLTPTHRGFDSFFGYLNGREEYYLHRLCQPFGTSSHGQDEMWELNVDNYLMNSSNSLLCGYDLRSNEGVAWNYSGRYSTHLFTQKAIDIIKDHVINQETKPFFLYLAYQAVHTPLEVPEAYVKPYTFIKDKKRRLYAGMASCMDEGVLNLTIAIENYGLWNNTVLIFSTDNGGDTFVGGNNWPLRGWKRSLWEGGIRGVGLVYSPLIKQHGSLNKGLIHVTDWFPTILSLASGNSSGLHLDGYDVWNSISNGEPSPRKEILHNIDPLEHLHGTKLNISKFDNRVRSAVRVGEWKLITGNPYEGRWIAPPEDTGNHSIPDPDPKSKNIWLFNLRCDPDEKSDLFERHQDVAVHMLNKLFEYQATAVPAVYPKPDWHCNPKLRGGVWGPWKP